MGWQQDMGSFDLGRLTIVGWLVSFLSIGAGVGAAMIGYTLWDFGLPPQEGENPQRRIRLLAAVGLAGTAGFFAASKFLLNLAGISLMRPKQEDETSIKGPPNNATRAE